MKAVLMSIQPKWCELIASGKKTVEVRKTKPKLDVPFKVYIYCTNTKPYLVWGDVFRGNWETEFTHISGYNRAEAEKIWGVFNGKVIGEFVCDMIGKTSWIQSPDHPLWVDGYDEESCLTNRELYEYSKGGTFYEWHISNLVIYDKPRELGEFIVPSKIGCCNEGKCRGCRYFDRGNGFNVEDDCNAKFSTDEYKPLRRPPQSWAYVERRESDG